MTSAPGQRRRRRRHLFYYLKVFDAQTGKLLGHLVDVTQEGLMLLADQPLDIGTPFRLRLQLPDELNGHADMVVEARSVWCRRDVNPDYFGIGFSLMAVGRSSRSILESMIYKFGFQD